MLAPETKATKRLPEPTRLCSWMYLVMPATANAPAGSGTDRVSSKMSLIAAQTWSLVTETMPSTSSEHSRNVSSPTSRTAVPSQKRPTVSSVTLRPAANERVIASPSFVSTPMTCTPGGAIALTYSAVPASRPPPPTHANTPSSVLGSVCRINSTAAVPCPAMTCGSSNGGMLVRPCSFSSRAHSRFASSKSLPNRTTVAPRRSTLAHLIAGVLSGMTIVQAMPSLWPASATPWAWLPAEQAMTPRQRSSSDSDAILLYAPRILKEKTGCRSSRLNRIVHPSLADSAVACVSGVGVTHS